MSNRIFLITAPSGAGKTSIMNYLKSICTGYSNSIGECISHTTRPMRSGEVDGVTYYFTDRYKFKEMIDSNEFAEQVNYDGYTYGISKSEVERTLEKYRYIYMIVEYRGYKQIKEVYPESVGIFLHMSIEDCMANMLLRGDSISKATSRINKYDDEIKDKGEFDYVVKNVRGKMRETAEIIKNIINQNS